jgi:hypothetical protein
MADKRGGCQSGQALAEYQVLFPGAIILVIGILLTFGNAITAAFGDVVDGITGTLGGGGEEGGTPVCVEWISVQGSSYCDQHPLCDLLEQGEATCTEGFNSCQVLYSEAPSLVVIKAGTEYQFYLDPSSFRYTPEEDSCFDVTYFPNPDPEVGGVILSWSPREGANGCHDASNVQVWAPDSVLTQCSEYSEG